MAPRVFETKGERIREHSSEKFLIKASYCSDNDIQPNEKKVKVKDGIYGYI